LACYQQYEKKIKIYANVLDFIFYLLEIVFDKGAQTSLANQHTDARQTPFKVYA